MLRWIAAFLAVLAFLALGFVFHGRLTFDRDAWLEDYAALKDHLGTAYANLDWMRERRGVDTRALDRRTEAVLRAAHTDRQARKALEGGSNSISRGAGSSCGPPTARVTGATERTRWRASFPRPLSPGPSWMAQTALARWSRS